MSFARLDLDQLSKTFFDQCLQFAKYDHSIAAHASQFYRTTTVSWSYSNITYPAFTKAYLKAMNWHSLMNADNINISNIKIWFQLLLYIRSRWLLFVFQRCLIYYRSQNGDATYLNSCLTFESNKIVFFVEK